MTVFVRRMGVSLSPAWVTWIEFGQNSWRNWTPKFDPDRIWPPVPVPALKLMAGVFRSIPTSPVEPVEGFHPETVPFWQLSVTGLESSDSSLRRLCGGKGCARERRSRRHRNRHQRAFAP